MHAPSILGDQFIRMAVRTQVAGPGIARVLQYLTLSAGERQNANG
jgi:hypothetical protein